MPNANAQKIIDACEAVWDDNQSDCNAFVRAVANQIGVPVPDGNADAIVHGLTQSGWDKTQDPAVAKTNADNGLFVIGGLKGSDHDPPRTNGHVVVVVTGPLSANGYPTAYWGTLGNIGRKNTTLNYAWREGDRDKVTYFSKAF